MVRSAAYGNWAKTRERRWFTTAGLRMDISFLQRHQRAARGSYRGSLLRLIPRWEVQQNKSYSPVMPASIFARANCAASQSFWALAPRNAAASSR